MQLDVDVQDGHGPERVAISRWSSSGKYVVLVHNYSDDVPLRESKARVVLKNGGTTRSSFECPATGDGRWWSVLVIDGKTGRVTPRNVIVAEAPDE